MLCTSKYVDLTYIGEKVRRMLSRSVEGGVEVDVHSVVLLGEVHDVVVKHQHLAEVSVVCPGEAVAAINWCMCAEEGGGRWKAEEGCESRR